jgi:hypothetical protein
VVGPYEVDLLWRAQRVVVEFDSWRAREPHAVVARIAAALAHVSG